MLRHEVIELIREEVVDNLQFRVLRYRGEEYDTLKVSYDATLAEFDFGQTEVG